MESGSAVAYFYRCSGSPDGRLRRVGLAISARLSESVKQVTRVYEKILHIRLENTCGFMTVVAIYVTPDDQELRDKEQLYH